MFEFKVQGLENTIKFMDNLPKQVTQLVDDELIATSFEIQALAVQNLDAQKVADQGYLRNSIVIQENLQTHRFETGSPLLYAVYTEFGTGMRTSVPKEWRDLALSYKDKKTGGTFAEFVQNLIDWAKRKGITPREGTDDSNYRNMATLMAIHILNNGLKARPFLYPAYKTATKGLKSRIVKAFKSIK